MSRYDNFEYEGQNTVAGWIKGLAVFIAIIGVVMFIMIGNSLKNPGIAIGGSIGSILGVLTLYGFGELIQIADDIKENSEYIRANTGAIRGELENKKKK